MNSQNGPYLPESRILGITSGKGGVGKSSVSVNLSVALAARGHSVALLDADVYGFSVPKMMGFEGELEIENERINPPRLHGVSVVSLGFFVDDSQPIVWRGPMLHKALEQFLSDVNWGQPEFVIVDMPPGTGDVALSMAEYLPQAEGLVVTTPQAAAARVAQRSGAMTKELNMNLIGVIENMSWLTDKSNEKVELFGSGGGQWLSDSFDVPLLGQIPLTTEMRHGADVGIPIVASDPSCETAFVFDSIATAIEKTKPKKKYKSELKFI